MKYSEEDIIGYIKQGYRPRVKKVDGRLYVTLRLGNSEKSLGRRNPDHESYVNALYEKHKPVDPKKISEEEKRRIKEKTRVYQEIDDIRDRVKVDTCIHNQDMLFLSLIAKNSS